MSSGREARARLLSRAEDYLLRHGLLDLTLTALAEGIGSNRRMLLYHFSSLDALVEEAIGDMLARRDLSRRLEELLRQPGVLLDRVDAAWAHLAAPEQEPWLRIYFARMGLSAEDPVRYREFLDQSRDGWPTLLRRVFADEGLDRAEERGRSVSALWSGLQIALLSGEPRDLLARTHRAVVTAVLA